MKLSRNVGMTVGDVIDLYHAGIVSRESPLKVPTSWAPVTVLALSTQENTGENALYLEAPVAESLEAWTHGRHGGIHPLLDPTSGPLRGLAAGAAFDSLIRQIEEGI